MTPGSALVATPGPALGTVATKTGHLILVPNTLDLGTEPGALRDVLADAVITAAAALTNWVVEDARSARAFLKRVAELAPLAQPIQLQSIVELPRTRKGSQEVIANTTWRALLQAALAGHDIGLLSEAGLPAVADPGALLVQAAHDLGVPVTPMAGASSLLLALAASGLNGQSFAFVGYLPQEAAARVQRLRELEALSRKLQQTQLMIETPYRNAALLAALVASLAPSTRLSVSCGLTLPGGFTRSASVAMWRQQSVQMPERWPAVFALLAT